jgi:hypothetical protein
MNNPKKAIIESSIFSSNKAYNYSMFPKSGLGGGLYYTCGPAFYCNVEMQGSNQFSDNIADNAGGGIKWDDLEPKIYQSISFSRNYAKLYGSDIASLP